ncbi:sigma-70 family RNA polymerase sigma factor [Deltaproteobacteria bacterium PRO3]|nr:sigma-70 family RNA polymerase sigma factor [Deltaproteobacteria bacterium PRO3]
METEPTPISEEALALRVQKGDREAFNRLVQEHVGRYFRIARRILGDSGEAEDIVQTAYLKFWQAPSKWNADLGWKFSTWFYRVVVNLCLDLKRRRRETPTEAPPEASAEAGTEDALIHRERQRRLVAWLEELPERQRSALQLCFYEGLSNEEAAQVMGLKLKALQSLLMRAKAQLREKVLAASGEKAS